MSDKNEGIGAINNAQTLPALDSMRDAAGVLNDARRLSILSMPVDDGLPAIIFDSTDVCSKECVVYEKCVAKGVAHEYDGKCPIQARYTKSVVNVLFATIGNRGDDVTVIEVGFLLIPLYSQLAKLKIHESSLNGKYIVCDNKGRISVHPLVKEIRACITNIQMLTKEILNKNDLRGVVHNLQQMAKHGDGLSGDELEGSANYYAALRGKRVEVAHGAKDKNIDDILNLSTPPAGISTKGIYDSVKHKYPEGVTKKVGKCIKTMTPEERAELRKEASRKNRDDRQGQELREECSIVLDEEAEQPAIVPEHLPPSTKVITKSDRVRRLPRSL